RRLSARVAALRRRLHEACGGEAAGQAEPGDQPGPPPREALGVADDVVPAALLEVRAEPLDLRRRLLGDACSARVAVAAHLLRALAQALRHRSRLRPRVGGSLV